MSDHLTEQSFNLFLQTLDDSPLIAAEKFMSLRERLEKFFEWRNCENVESLTDVVFDRVIKKVSHGEKLNNTEAYCVTVAKFVLMENRREVLRNEELDENSRKVNLNNISDNVENDSEIKDIRLNCLDKCLAELSDEKRKLLLGYFDTDEATMIATRQKLADQIGINLNTLRIRISRLKTKLEICTKDCCD